MPELTRRCDRCTINGWSHHGKVCIPGCVHGEVDIDQRHMDGPLKGQCIPDDVWTLDQLEELGAARRFADRDLEGADFSIDLGTGTVELGDAQP